MSNEHIESQLGWGFHPSSPHCGSFFFITPNPLFVNCCGTVINLYTVLTQSTDWEGCIANGENLCTVQTQPTDASPMQRE